MNDIEVMKTRARELASKKRLTAAEKAEVADMYKTVLSKTLQYSKCPDCLRDACIEVYTYIEKHGKFEPKHEYLLRRGVLLRLGEFGTDKFVTRDSITDEVAKDYLRNGGDITLFDVYPKNWEEDVKGKPEAEPEAENAETDE